MGAGAHFRSFGAETVVAACAAYASKSAAFLALRTVSVDPAAFNAAVSAYLVVTAFVFVFWKTVFPTARHRSYRTYQHVIVAQVLATAWAAVLFEHSGECWKCGENAADILVYALPAGLVFGVMYSIFSKLFSVDVDTRHTIL